MLVAVQASLLARSQWITDPGDKALLGTDHLLLWSCQITVQQRYFFLYIYLSKQHCSLSGNCCGVSRSPSVCMCTSQTYYRLVCSVRPVLRLD